ncbi:hypothetical protein HPP92_000767 [Vanilla planifolia]|uniref:Topoisomerase II-associated protein PAT1 n=1 Tax=Vanilla planifolia TaxID=51239 RepID=A0A835VKS4_VANPL|nr:hypothetical protein HPP92_000767 [Vanilla planifolia]
MQSFYTGLQLPLSAHNISPFSSSLHLAGIPHSLPYGGNMANFAPLGISISNRPHKSWVNQSPSFVGESSATLPGLLQQQSSLNGFMPPPLLARHQQQRLQLQLQPAMSHVPLFQSQMFGPRNSLPMTNRFDAGFGMADHIQHRPKSSYKGRQSMRHSQQSSDSGSQKSEHGSLQFRSKYMSAEEIESILRMQHAAMHNSDPYVDDYYHQACLAKKYSGSGLNNHFYPSFMRDISSRARSGNEPHSYLHVDALGRISFSSIRKPRPLLEVDPPSVNDGSLEQKSSLRPLELEPLLAARITIEDGLCLLLDVDDIDRLLRSGQPQDGSSQLRRRRQVLLEGLAASLQLVDPLGPDKASRSFGLIPKDDLVFLRLASLPKGRKLLSRYLRLLHPGSELTRIVCMTFCRHLRVLFGGLSSDTTATETTSNLAQTAASCMQSMDLSALSACLAAVVCSCEQPPLRPLGSSAGDGATVIIISALERATDLLTDLNAAGNYSMPIRALWQASFDAFFGLLIKYCMSKYDSLMQTLLTLMPASAIAGPDLNRAISKEMPVELLRASLPHTDEHQRKQLLDFAKRSMPVEGSITRDNPASITSESVSG